MNTDATFFIGRNHTICQDYAIATPNFVMVSDGCSSSPNTDIGARLLVHSALRNIESGAIAPCFKLEVTQEFHKIAARFAMTHVSVLGLKPEAIDATMNSIYVPDNDSAVFVNCYGDGVIVYKTKAGELNVRIIDYKDNYPIYPSYSIQPEKEKQLGALTTNVKSWRDISIMDKKIVFDNKYNITQVISQLFINAEALEWIVVMSDGVLSFTEPVNNGTNKGRKPIPIENFIEEMLDFKTSKGVFIERTLKAFLSKKQKLGWEHFDDLAVAGIIF